MINIEIIEGGARMKCISCSKEIKDGSVFCEFCGNQQLEVSLLDESKEISKEKMEYIDGFMSLICGLIQGY